MTGIRTESQGKGDSEELVPSVCIVSLSMTTFRMCSVSFQESEKGNVYNVQAAGIPEVPRAGIKQSH